jgi:phosphopantothenoylcysteine decarboxylase/phosphopantothenate--cysteine ligase
MLKGKKIIVGITGGIAAYKIPLLVRLLKKEGAEVQVVMTRFAKEFVTPLTLSTVSGRPVLSDFFDKNDGTWNSHVDLGLWADAMIIAPLTANSMAKMAVGMADNFLMTLVLSARCPLFFAPSMDFDMFQHPTTTENIKKLQSLGYHYIEPASGELASGLTGPGRMKEPEELLKEINFFFEEGLTFKGKKVLISAGPTYEPIDPVRFIGNRSSGKMGLALARAFSEKGAQVELVLGPVSRKPDLLDVHVVPVNTAEEMYDACTKAFENSDVAVMAAAVADFTPVQVASEKIKKEKGIEKIELRATPDILASLGKVKKNNQILVGFALETDDEFSNAKKKLERKNLDMIVLNSLKDEGAGFGVDTNKITVLKKDGTSNSFPLKTKDSVARDIISEIVGLIKEKS